MREFIQTIRETDEKPDFKLYVEVPPGKQGKFMKVGKGRICWRLG